MSFTIVQPSANNTRLTLCFLIAFLWSDLAIGSQPAMSIASKAATSKLPINNDHQLQVFKNCVLVKQRPLNRNESTLYKKLKDHELKMEVVEAPLALMEQQLGQQTTLLESISDQITQQVKQHGEPDPVLLETQAELSQQISAIVDSFQPDIDTVSKYGEEIGNLADAFSQLIATDYPPDSYDQIRVIRAGETATTDCNQGMFFSKTIQ
jgi:hypothetical protein